MSRPQVLFPLFSDLETLLGVGPKTAKLFPQMHVEKPRDLVFTLPHSGIERTRRTTVQGAPAPCVITIEVTVGLHNAPRQKGRPYRVSVEDEQASFMLVFFHARSEWLLAQLPPGERRVVSGK